MFMQSYLDTLILFPSPCTGTIMSYNIVLQPSGSQKKTFYKCQVCSVDCYDEEVCIGW